MVPAGGAGLSGPVGCVEVLTLEDGVNHLEVGKKRDSVSVPANRIAVACKGSTFEIFADDGEHSQHKNCVWVYVSDKATSRGMQVPYSELHAMLKKLLSEKQQKRLAK